MISIVIYNASTVTLKTADFSALVEAMSNCADEAEAWINQNYITNEGKHPEETNNKLHTDDQAPYERDMEPIKRARELLAKIAT